MKNILLKCNETKQDPYLALLQYRNTPSMEYAQALMNRQLNTTLATAPQNLKSEPIDSAKFISQREKQQQKQKLYHDQSAKPLPELHDSESVRIKKSPEAKWEPAIVLRAKYQTPRSVWYKHQMGQSTGETTDTFSRPKNPHSTLRRTTMTTNRRPTSHLHQLNLHLLHRQSDDNV